MATKPTKGARKKPAQASAGKGKPVKPVLKASAKKAAKQPKAFANPKPLNDRQRKFVQIHVTGVPAGRAYEQAGFSARGNAAEACAVKLLRNAQVENYADDLRKKAKEAAEDTTILSLNDKRRFLARVVRTPIGTVDETSDLCQEYTSHWEGGRKGKLRRGDAPEGNEQEDEPSYEVVKVKMPDKLRALELDAKLAGELKDKVEIEDKTPIQPPSAEDVRRSRELLKRFVNFQPRDIRGAVIED